MTDKTLQNRAENPMNTPTTLAGTTDTVRDSEPKSRALPQADTLKERFKAGSIPLQTDFADLIDLANMGRQAVGGAEGQTGPANGFTLSSMGRLELKPDVDGGLTVGSNGVGIKLAANSGLSADKTNGLKIVPEQMFQKNMVMMFAGTVAEIPKGWALCDGSPGTPNLIDRFILGSKPAESGKFNSATLTGSDNTKVYNKGSSQETVTGSISINSTSLTERQIPSHKHLGGVAYYLGDYSRYGKEQYGASTKSIADEGLFYRDDDSPRYLYTSSIGSGEGHTHTGKMATADHKHMTDVIPPYYTLAFIIKL